MLCRRQALEHLVADRLHADPLDERLDDAEVDVRFEQRQPDFAKRRLDVLRRQPSLATQGLEDILQACAE